MNLSGIKRFLHDPFSGKAIIQKLLSKYYNRKKRYYFILRKITLSGIIKIFGSDNNINICVGNLNIISKPDGKRFSDLFSQKNSSATETAGRYLLNHYNILGSGWIELSGPDWHRDYKSGFRWKEGRFYGNYELVNLNNTADVKFPWELSRGHQYLKLGQAYLLTRDEKYSIKFINDITGWIEQNPFMRSINWTSTMEVAIRAVNWIFALSMFNNSARVDKNFRKKILISLYLHGYFIYRNPEKKDQNNHNHYLSDLAGQIFLGLLFNGIGEANIWLEKGKDELFKEIRYQILPSGADYERSLNYHRLVLELISYTVIIMLKNKMEVPADILFRIEKMFEFIMVYTKPDGSVPVIGDQDDGRFLPFSESINIDHRYLLSVGSVLFKREDFRNCSTGFNQDVFFLMGPDAISCFENWQGKMLKPGSAGYKDAGFFIMRKDNNYMFINQSGKGRYSEINSGTHTHSDLLSFELYCEDKSFLIDPGTFAYSADPDERLKFRSTAMHNTVVIDKHDQNELKRDELWGFERNAIPVLINWESNDREDTFEGEHNGYARLDNPVIHRRKIVFSKEKATWTITDNLEGEGSHLFEWFFHFDQNIDLLIDGNSSVVTKSPGTNLRLNFQNSSGLSFSIFNEYVSKQYGSRYLAKVLKVSVQNTCPLILKIIISKI